MSKCVGRIFLWISGVVCMVLICVKMIQPIMEQELINSEKYLVTPELHQGDVLEQSITLEKAGLSQIEAAFVYAENLSADSKAMIEIVSDNALISKSIVSVRELPYQTLTVFKADGEVGDQVTLRISNVSEGETNTQFALLYTDNDLRFFENVSLYELNGEAQSGQLISRYTYQVGYDYYMALTTVFFLVMMCMAIDAIIFKK